MTWAIEQRPWVWFPALLTVVIGAWHLFLAVVMILAPLQACVSLYQLVVRPPPRPS